MTGRYGTRNVDGVRTLTTDRERPEAWCAECGWTRDPAPGAAWLAVRQAARRHAGLTGHTTHAAIRYVYTYAPDPRPGWTR